MGQSEEKEGHETGQKISEKEQIKQNTFEKQTDTYYDARLYETNVPRHRVPNQDDDKDFFMGQVKAITAALSVPLSSVITPFEGDASKFKRWIKEIEKYGLLSGKQGHEIPMLAYFTSKGSVGDFIKRYLDETDASEEMPSRNDLKESLKKPIRRDHRLTTRVSSNAEDAAKFKRKCTVIRGTVVANRRRRV